MTLRWVAAGASRDMSYMTDGIQYVIRTDKGHYTLVQKSRLNDVLRIQPCKTKQEALDLAEVWHQEAH